MAEFSADWLTLREPYDHAARATGLLERLGAWSANQASLRIVDLGAGLGSTYRAVQPHIQCPAQWCLVDHDPDLLALLANLPVQTIQADLACDLEAVAAGADLITGSALIDLVSEDWLRRLVALKKPVYLALSFDGRIEWQPGLPLDSQITGLFCSHQAGDKGFGPALGPRAGATLQELLGAEVQTTASDWIFEPQDQAIQSALIEGIAGAALDVMTGPEIKNWAVERQRLIDLGQSRLTIGHVDQLYLG